MTTTPAPNTSGSLDWTTIGRLRTLAAETMPELFGEILETFRDDAVKYLAAIQDAMAQNDPVTLGRTAHALKGAGLNTGALTLAGLSARIETAAEAGGLAMVPPLLAQLESEIHRVRADIELELAHAA